MMGLLELCWNTLPSLISRSILRSSGRDEATRLPDEWDPRTDLTRRGREVSTNWPLWDKSLMCVFSSQRASTEHLCPVDFLGWEMSGIITGSRQILLKSCTGAVAVVIAAHFEEVAPWGVPLTAHFPRGCCRLLVFAVAITSVSCW